MDVADYTGGRTAKEIVDFALKQAAQVTASCQPPFEALSHGR